MIIKIRLRDEHAKWLKYFGEKDASRYCSDIIHMHIARMMDITEKVLIPIAEKEKELDFDFDHREWSDKIKPSLDDMFYD